MKELIYRNGDIIEAFLNKEFLAIGHQANCFCTAKSGLAPNLFNAVPALRAADHKTEIGDRRKLGGVTFAQLDDQWAFNLYGQYHHEHDHPEYGTVYPFLSNALCRMELILREKGAENASVGFPLLGCGFGGGKWEDVAELVSGAFGRHKGDVYIYRL